MGLFNDKQISQTPGGVGPKGDPGAILVLSVQKVILVLVLN